MHRCRHWMLLLVLPAFTSPAFAGPLNLFKHQNKPDPAERVPALIKAMKSDPDERKREQAADELREYDPKAFEEIVPTLIDGLKNDSSTGVRLACITSITKLRPVSQQMVYALEQAVANDASFKVRTSARATLLQWRVVYGVPTGRRTETQSQTEEPPLAIPLPKTGSGPMLSPQSPNIGSPGDGTDASRPAPAPGRSRSLFPLFPAKNTKPDRSKDDGPVLNPPM